MSSVIVLLLTHRLMRTENWREALRVSQVLSQSIDILRVHKSIPDRQKLEYQAIALDKLATCYSKLGDFDSALTCITQMEGLGGGGMGAKVAYTKCELFLSKRDFDSAVEALSKLCTFGDSAFEFARQVTLKAIVESHYDIQVIQRAYLTATTAFLDTVKLTILRLDELKVAFGALRISREDEPIDRIMDIFMSASSKLMHVNPLDATERSELLGILRNAIHLCFKAPHFLWCSRLCTLLMDFLGLKTDAAEMAQLACVKTQALLALGDDADALKCAKAAYGGWWHRQRPSLYIDRVPPSLVFSHPHWCRSPSPIPLSCVWFDCIQTAGLALRLRSIFSTLPSALLIMGRRKRRGIRVIWPLSTSSSLS